MNIKRKVIYSSLIGNCFLINDIVACKNYIDCFSEDLSIYKSKIAGIGAIVITNTPTNKIKKLDTVTKSLTGLTLFINITLYRGCNPNYPNPKTPSFLSFSPSPPPVSEKAINDETVKNPK